MTKSPRQLSSPLHTPSFSCLSLQYPTSFSVTPSSSFVEASISAVVAANVRVGRWRLSSYPLSG